MSTALRTGASASTVSAISLALGVIVLSALVLLAADPALKSRMAQAHLPAQSAHSRTAAPSPAAIPADPRLAEIEQRFGQAVVMLHARRYEEALVALERVITLSPRLPEAYVNSGYALLGLEQYDNARDFFLAATELDPYQGNAYWGLAVALEALEDLDGALGAMRTYVHLAPPDDPYVRKARSALWEWDTRRARGPLPEHEEQWIEERTREWEARNLPDRDAPLAPELDIPVGGNHADR
jgi:tetratricopeptide (TPR) repeat protein